MTLEEVKNSYPNLARSLPENVFTDRELVVVDYNYDEIDAEEAGEFDPSEYNHFVYIAEAAREIIGEGGLSKLASRMEAHSAFDDFFASEEDLFGVQSDLTEEEIAKVVFSMIEEIVT